MKAMGLLRGVSHTEFIKSKADGKFYFLETSARVGGANLAELVEAAIWNKSLGRMGED